MSKRKERKKREVTHYPFLVSWKPDGGGVKGKTRTHHSPDKAVSGQAKKADSLAQDDASRLAKKNIVRSLIIISLVLILEIVVYLAWNEIMP